MQGSYVLVISATPKNSGEITQFMRQTKLKMAQATSSSLREEVVLIKSLDLGLHGIQIISW